MNVYDYIKEYGNYTFQEKKFNEVDAVIFSFISYVDYTKIFEENSVVTINEAGKKHLISVTENDKNITATKEANQLLKCLKDTVRYKDCILFNYEYIGNEVLQFGALSIEYEKDKVYVSFEGTDSLFSGWREDFLLSGEFPTKTHKLAIKYVNKHFTFSNKKIILGGHSKGGNLALIAGMYANRIVRHKITKIYSADGPGLLDKEYKSLRYQNTKKKFVHIIPDCSIVGILLNHSGDKVVKATRRGIIAHNIRYW